MSRSVSEVLDRLDAVALVNQYVQLKKAGRSYKALCPFHGEKTPSFHLDPAKKLWHCFGCGAGGSLIDFYGKIEKLSFPEALQALAEKVGLEMRCAPKDRGRRELLSLLEKAMEFYRSHCEDAPFKQFLKSRGIERGMAETFHLGFSPHRASIYRFLVKEGFSLDTILLSGLVQQRGNQRRELFQERLMVPLFSVTGQVVGFAGRSLIPEAKPKYLNTPESPVFKKGDLVYGLAQAKGALQKKGEALLVEGYADVWQCAQQGFDQAVASMGTALTKRQVQLLSRFVEKVTFCFDGDPAGLRAMTTSVPLFFEQRVQLSVATLNGELDPDDFLRQRGSQDFAALLQQAQPFYSFTIDQLVEQHPPHILEKRAKLQDALKDFLKNLGDPMLIEKAREYAHKKTGMALPLSFTSQKKEKSKPLVQALQEKERVEAEAIALLFTEQARVVRQQLIVEDFSLPIFREIARASFALLDAQKERTSLQINDIWPHLATEGREILAQILAEHQEAYFLHSAKAIVAALEKKRVQKKRQELQALIAKKLQEHDIQSANELYAHYRKLKEASLS